MHDRDPTGGDASANVHSLRRPACDRDKRVGSFRRIAIAVSFARSLEGYGLENRQRLLQPSSANQVASESFARLLDEHTIDSLTIGVLCEEEPVVFHRAYELFPLPVMIGEADAAFVLALRAR